MTQMTPQPGILDIKPYVGGESTVAGVDNVVKLSSNENPYGPSEAVKTAVRHSASNLHRYPSTDHLSLRQAIAKIHKLDADRIICGVGSDEIISLLCQAYAGPGDEVIHTEHGFAMYRISTLANGATPVQVPEHQRFVDVSTILDAVTDRTRLIFIANPANPTGTMLDAGTVSRLATQLPDHVLLVLDGAYAEYVEDFDGSAELVDKGQNVIVTRTFSKLYGMGGMRVGWGYGPDEVIEVLNRVRGPFNLSSTALAAAEAAVRDVNWVKKCRDENTRLRDWLTEALRSHGVECDDSAANFVLARFADQATAEACDDHLRAEGLLVRRVAGYGLPNALRITIGDEASCRRVAHAVGQFMNKIMSKKP